MAKGSVSTILLGAFCLLTPACASDEGRMGSSEHAPQLPLRDRGHAVLLLVDEEQHGDSPKLPADRNYDLEWVNLLGSHFGGCDVADLAALRATGPSLLEERRLLVLPRRCLAAMDSSLAPQLDAAVRAGMDILAELPDRSWSERLGLRLNSIESRRPLPWPQQNRHDPSPARFRAPPPEPLALEFEVGSYWPGHGSLGSARTLGSPTGRPMLWNFPMGDGRWILLGVDFAGLASRLRQGVPDDSFRMASRHDGELADRLSPADLIAAAQLLRADAPWLDRWSVSILDDRHASSPWPRLWPAPLEAEGWLVETGADSLAWTANLDASLVERLAAGSSHASSFGPDGSAYGWSFGSAFPFRPLSVDGGMHLLWELPHLGPDSSRLTRWLRRNAAGAQGPLTFPRPVGEAARATARKLGHRVATAEQLLDFWERRHDATLRWSFTGRELLIEAETPPGDLPLDLALPVRWQDLALAAWELHASDAASRRSESFQRGYLRITLPEGASNVRVRYEPFR